MIEFEQTGAVKAASVTVGGGTTVTLPTPDTEPKQSELFTDKRL
jgi:hypothetical protein